jgi:uncharacterized membrane protein
MTDLPPLPFWQARSFWLTLFAVIASMLPAFGLTPPLWLADPGTVDLALQIASAVAAALAWRERLAPRRRLTIA